MLDVAVKSHVLRMDDLRAAFPPADTRPVIALHRLGPSEPRRLATILQG
jgi:hypothetical protein